MASKKRSISFSEDLDLKLVELCEALSISPNSYINNVVSKAVLSDRTSMIAQQVSSQGMDKMIEMIGAAIQDDSKPKL